MEEFVNLLQRFAFEILLFVILPFVAKALAVLTKKWMAELEATKPQLAWYLQEAVSISVAAAEQAGLAGFVEDKKQYAFQIAQQWLDEHGWDEVNIDILEAAIEAEVLKQFPK